MRVKNFLNSAEFSFGMVKTHLFYASSIIIIFAEMASNIAVYGEAYDLKHEAYTNLWSTVVKRLYSLTVLEFNIF